MKGIFLLHLNIENAQEQNLLRTTEKQERMTPGQEIELVDSDLSWDESSGSDILLCARNVLGKKCYASVGMYEFF